MLKSLYSAKKTFSLLSDYKKQLSSTEKLRIKKRLLEHLSEERGIWLKAIQLLEGNNADWDLQEIEKGELPAVPFEVIETILEENYGENWRSLFHSIDENAKTASFSQVHQATLINDEKIALKIQYPFIEEKLQEQLQLLKLTNLFDFAGKTKKWGMDFEALKNYLKQSLIEELDYQQEANNIEFMRNVCAELPWVIIPQLIPQLCRPKVLAMSWEEGVGISAVARSWSNEQKQELGQKIFKGYFYSLFNLGAIQADPNDGNFLYRKGATEIELVWLDFGAIHRFPPHMLHSLAALLTLTPAEIEHVDLLSAFVDLGFDRHKLQKIESCLPAITLILFEGIKAERPFFYSNWDIKAKLNLALGEYKWWFRSAGGVDFFALMKSFLVVKNHLAQLNVAIKTGPLILEIINKLPKSTLTKKAHKSIPLDQRFIRILVQENGQEKVQLALPLTAIWDLPTLMDTELLSKIASKGIDINLIIHQATLQGLPSKVLFELIDGTKYTKVWID